MTSIIGEALALASVGRAAAEARRALDLARTYSTRHPAAADEFARELFYIFQSDIEYVTPQMAHDPIVFEPWMKLLCDWRDEARELVGP